MHRILVLILLAGLLTCAGCKSRERRDREFRGTGSREAWLNATGGAYDGAISNEWSP